MFPEGYSLGSEHEWKFSKEAVITKIRQDYVNELFDLKAKLDKGARSLDDEFYESLY